MTIENGLASLLDAGDFENASLAILAHPRSVILSQDTVRMLFEFGTCGVVPSPLDIVMIGALGDLMLAEIGGEA